MKTRGGAKQRKKHEEVFQYHRNQGNVGLKLLEKLGWEEGKGLGDGKGRCGKPWGFKGHFARKEEVIQTEDIVWQWTLTSEDGAKFAFAWCGLPFPGSQVVEVPKVLSSRQPGKAQGRRSPTGNSSVGQDKFILHTICLT